MKNKFVIYMSVFLSLLALATVSPHGKQSPRVETLEAATAVTVTIPATTSTTVAPTTTAPPETTTTVTVPTTEQPVPTTVKRTTTTAPPETVPETQEVEAPPVESACGPYAMSVGEAHACWDGLIAGYKDENGNWVARNWDTTTAFRIMYCESNGKYNAYNSSYGATGLFQILGGPIDPAANVAVAYDMYSARGWQPWSCH